MTRKLLCLLAAAMAVVAAADEPTPVIDQGVVQVIVSYQDNDPFLPWQKVQPGMRLGYGVAVDATHVLTTESLVRNHRLVELRKPREGAKIPATVVISDAEVDLALLRVDPPRPDWLKPLPLATRMGLQSRVDILQFDGTTEIQKGSAQVIQIAMSDLPKAPYQSLTFDLLTDLNVNGEGAPAFINGTLAGLVMGHDQVARIAAMIPYPVISRFLHMGRQAPYAGFASAGFMWTALVDPAKRSYLGVKQDSRGVLILACVPRSGAAEVLQPNDVILEWDGHPIDNLGYYEDLDFGRLSLSYLIKGRRAPGEGAQVRLLRDREEKSVLLPLAHRPDRESLIPENTTGERVEYLVDGGFVITELTGRYLRAHGNDWDRQVDPRLVHMYLASRYRLSAPDEHVVILSLILPDPINIGYQHFRNDVITSINNQAVSNMTDVFRIVDKDGSLKRLTLRSVGVDLVIDQSARDEANDRLAIQYRVPFLRYQRPAK